jgi:mannan polymerase II complex ANP1 subunit
MGFEVVGLPHYVIWHVYEPSADDIRRMEEMDREKAVKEMDVEDVDVSKARWEKDRKVIEEVIKSRKSAKVSEETSEGGKKVVVGGEEGPVAHVGEEGVPSDRGNGLTGIDREKSSELVEKVSD